MSIAVGLIGAGVMGKEHGRILSMHTPSAHLAGVCDFDPDKARAIAGKARIFADPLDLITSKEIDAVLIASPDSTHADLVQACIAAEKPVLCEKPLAMSAEQARLIVEAECLKEKAFVQVGYMRRFDPGYIELKRLFEANAVGKPEILHNFHRNPVAPEWMTGDMLITNAFVHEIDVMRWVMDTELEAVRITVAEKGDPMMIVTRLANGAMSSTELYMNCKFGYQVHAELVGEEGTISLPEFSAPVINKSGHRASHVPRNWIPRFVTAYQAQTRSWIQSIISGVPNHGATAWDGYITTLIAEHLAERSGTDQTIKLELPLRPSLYR
ncbi:MAG: Gfo/Idh/MocA family oxidoreductase [Candidatus Pseudomonas phytovorans]|uniref:Gfo/Idh/MocA family oxidoreductase n=1 Tax=Candidatus Pseudomonas phytovorans TaxID=3121377 RepID=A0AAJ6BAD5_9PSED|nr:Gfo/Idh/MocA family oxidoreductase [Pseudomonas sp.]WEK29628.1 MAG: Gfo/Idh/MocA family oxidoreductase [Pseudomonas sp.]